nr:GntR family transcriptional regulator [Planctomycetota bacterium]
MTLSEVVKQGVLARILNGDFPIGSTLPAAGELAALYACSQTSVQRALGALADEGFITRVRNRGSVVARRPCRRRLCLLASVDQHISGILQAPLTDALSRHGFQVDTIPFGPNPETALAHSRRLRSTGAPIDHLVALGHFWGGMPASEVRKLSAPFRHRVAFDLDPFATVGGHLVTLDHAYAAQEVLDHLVRLGHRRIAVMAGASPEERNFASISFAACARLVEGSEVSVIPHYMSQDWLGGLCRRIRSERITACWALNDRHAQMLIDVLHEDDLEVPRHISVVGRFDTLWSVA